MTSVNEQEWKGVVQRVLEVWSGYQLALEHASGGDDTRQKHEVSIFISFEKLNFSFGY